MYFTLDASESIDVKSVVIILRRSASHEIIEDIWNISTSLSSFIIASQHPSYAQREWIRERNFVRRVEMYRSCAGQPWSLHINVRIKMESTIIVVLQSSAAFSVSINTTRFQIIVGYLYFDSSPYKQTIFRRQGGVEPNYQPPRVISFFHEWVMQLLRWHSCLGTLAGQESPSISCKFTFGYILEICLLYSLHE